MRRQAPAGDGEEKPKKNSRGGKGEKVAAGGAKIVPAPLNADGKAYKEALLATLKDKDWMEALQPEFNKPYFDQICNSLALEQKSEQDPAVFPPLPEIFSAFNFTPLNSVRVVILGQDPYHDDGQAHGLCFSVQKGVPPPPSLKNMYKELTTDIPGFVAPKHGYLEAWARRGVLLLNASLTVRAHNANAHKDLGWQQFTDAVIDVLAKRKGIAYILWGLFAQKKAKRVPESSNCVIKAAHPSPLSATKFYGCKCFSAVNNYFKEQGQPPLDWTLPATI